ncbi:MAG: hypothetical protein Q8876_06780 [Bacillota bacterium]|nr:hypothetical protein [Bacillota bacterium]
MKDTVLHMLRYGTVAETKHFENAISSYDYLCINANNAAHVSYAISKFVIEKFFSKPEKGFIIDPLTYAFQDNINLLKSKSITSGEMKIKKSIEKLIDIYDYPINKVRKDTPIFTSDFSSDQILNEFCMRVLKFQYNIVYDSIKSNELDKYIEYVMSDEIFNLPQLHPKFLIAPYFYLDPQDPNYIEWLSINIKFIEVAYRQSKQLFNGIDIFGQIVINKNVLKNPGCIKKIIDAYKNINCKGFTIWVDDLIEQEATIDELNGFVNLLKGLRTKTIFNMYGGYFSVLLTHKDISLLNGVSHGMEYGESRKVYPVGGGIPVSKYYYLPIHQRLDFTKAFYLLKYVNAIDTSKENWGDPRTYYYGNICRCSQCKKILKSEMSNFVEFESKEFYEIKRNNQIQRRKKASSNTKENCLYHYLLCKKMEFYRVHSKPLDELLNDLNINYDIYSKYVELQDLEFNYLDKWVNILRKVIGDDKSC